MPTETQLKHLRSISEGIAAAGERRKASECALEHVRELVKRWCADVSKDTDHQLTVFSEDTDNHIGFGFANRPTGFAYPDGRRQMELGASMLLAPVCTGMLDVVFLPAALDQQPNPRPTVRLMTCGPHEIAPKLDQFLEQFLRLAADGHWSRTSNAKESTNAATAITDPTGIN